MPHPEDERITRLGWLGCDRGNGRRIHSSGFGKGLPHPEHLPRGESRKDRLRSVRRLRGSSPGTLGSSPGGYRRDLGRRSAGGVLH